MMMDDYANETVAKARVLQDPISDSSYAPVL